MLTSSILTLSILASGAAPPPDSAKPAPEKLESMVPASKVLKTDGNEFDLLTPKNTVVEIELNRDGSLDEASGDFAQGGDVFIPSDGHLTLANAVAALKAAGKTPSGDWSYEKSFLHGWVYKFEGSENGKTMKYLVNAENGRLVGDRRDL